MGTIPKENPDQPASKVQGSQSTELNDLKQRVKRNHTRVSHTRQVVDYLLRLPESQDCFKALQRIMHCSDYLSFHHYYQKGKVKLASASFCKVPQICSQCAQRRATKYAQAILQSVQANPSKHLYLVTLTVRNSHDLTDALGRLYNYFHILNRRYHKKNKNDSITNRFLGGVWTIEFTYDKKTGWHPHIHGLIATESPLYTHEVRKEWESISNGDSFMCDATEIKATDEQSLWSAVAEVSKYTLKNSCMPPVQLLEVYKAIKGKQLIRRFGILKGKDVTYEGDLSEYENEPFFRFTFRYFDDAYKFQEKMHQHFDNHAQYKEYINEKAKD